ncbi:Chymotrypsin-like elastase family member 2A, partial [Armadillidium nasatum]
MPTMAPTEDPITQTQATEDPEEVMEMPDGNEQAMEAQKHEIFFIAAEYDKSKGSWIWEGTHDKIDWDILLYGTPNGKKSLKVIDGININKCLALNLTASNETGPIIVETECISDNGYICKMVLRQDAQNLQAQNAVSLHLMISTSKNREHGFANFNYKPGGCQVKIEEKLMKCEEVLQEIEKESNETTHKYSVARVGSSYYYIANSTDECIGREAIIQNEDVHSFIMQLLATRENYYMDKNIKIGLTFKLEDSMAYWVNGKPDDYYDQFWLPGEPKRDSSVDGGCAAYSNVDGTATYLWRLFSKEMCETFDKICELPLQKSSSVGRTKEETCGKRYERGVLAKATVNSIYSSDEANFGEFPWQAAIMYPEKYGREVKRKFACSGALIHESFVLTSAHCVTSVNVQKDFVVVLGQHDLYDDFYILEPLVVDVKEVILHKDFTVRKSSLDDLALLQLDNKVDTSIYPHIGLGCLPDPEEIRSHGGNWECFVTGWSKNFLNVWRRNLQRRNTARYVNKDHYDLLYNSKRYAHDYKHQHAYYRDEDSELLCTNSAHNECLEDQSPLLVCKKAAEYVRKPFYDNQYGQNRFRTFKSSDPQNYEPSTINYRRDTYSPYHQYGYEESIINAYGEERFNSDKWYIIGIGNTMSQCRDFDEFQISPIQGVLKRILPKSHIKPSKSDVHKLKEHLGESYGKEYDYTSKIPHRGLNYKNRYGVT